MAMDDGEKGAMPGESTRFKPGWAGGPGRPKGFKTRQQEWKEAFEKAVQDGDIVDVARSMIQAAKEKGDAAAATLMLKYTLGLPAQTIVHEEKRDGFELANDAASTNAGAERLNGLAAGHGDDNGG